MVVMSVTGVVGFDRWDRSRCVVGVVGLGFVLIVKVIAEVFVDNDVEG